MTLPVADTISPPPPELVRALKKDLKDSLISLKAILPRQKSRTDLRVQDHELPWPSFDALILSHRSELPQQTIEALQKLQSCLPRLEVSIKDALLTLDAELLPECVAGPNPLWKHRADYLALHECARQSRTEGTGQWFLDSASFKEWLSGEEDTLSPDFCPALFCPGEPGSGKTIIMSSAIDEVQKRQKDKSFPNIGLAYFYFSYKTSASLQNVALALLEQFYLQSPSPVEEVAELESFAANAEHIPLPLILSALSAAARKFQRAYIILDALNECPPAYHNDLLRLLASIRSSPRPIRLLASSRSYSKFDDVFKDSPKIDIRPSLQDVELYTNSRLLNRYDVDLRRQILDATLITTMIRHHMFLPVVRQLDTILDKHTSKEIQEQLSEIAPSLDAIIRHALKLISQQESHIVKVAETTLIWLYYSQRPLETTELIDALQQIHPEVDTTLVVSACMGLVQAQPKIAFVNFPVGDILETTISGNEEVVARHCLDYLNSQKFDEATSSLTVNILVRSNPLLSYAANYWGRHLRNATQKCDARAKCVLKELLRKLLGNHSRVAGLCHILFASLPRPETRTRNDGLVKSSWLHLVAYFGLDWAIDLPIATLAVERDEWGRTPLHIAAEHGFDDCVEALLGKFSLNLEDEDGRTVWHYAAMNGNPETIRHLLAWTSFAPISRQPSLGVDNNKLGRGKSPLEYAVLNGNSKAFQALFPLYTTESDRNAPVNPVLENALFAALIGGRMEIVKLLLTAQTPRHEHIQVATRVGFSRAVRLLSYLDLGTSDPTKLHSIMLIAATNAWNDILEFLLRNRYCNDGNDREICAALRVAVEAGNIRGVWMLLGRGAEPEAFIDGIKLVAYAARHGMIEIVKYLLAAGAEPTPAAFAAVEFGQCTILELLLQQPGLAAHIKAENGQSLLEAAREAGYPNVLGLVRDFEAGTGSGEWQTSTLGTEFGGLAAALERIGERRRRKRRTTQSRRILSSESLSMAESGNKFGTD